MTSDPQLHTLGARAAGLFPPSVVVAAARPCDPGNLLPPEQPAIARMVATRQREFAGGRAAARVAMHRVTGRTLAVPMGPDRAPVWPAGLRGSITHAAGLCLAAATADPAIQALGLDLEDDAPLPIGTESAVLLPAEAGQHPRAVFSAKETVFKALYPQVGHIFGFDAVQITLGDGRFLAETRVPLGPVPAGQRLAGRLWIGDGLILTALAV